jgi:hypothetical protein
MPSLKNKSMNEIIYFTKSFFRKISMFSFLLFALLFVAQIWKVLLVTHFMYIYITKAFFSATFGEAKLFIPNIKI